MSVKISIIDDVQVLDYSKNGHFHVRFNYLGEPTEENPKGSYEDGGYLEFKFKDPRDTLKFLIRYLEVYDGLVLSKLFEYVNYGADLKVYNQLETYYLLLLGIKLQYSYLFAKENPLPKKELEEYTPEELDRYKIIVEKFRDEFENVIRTAHKYAVANTWKIWNDNQPSSDSVNNESGEVTPSKKSIIKCSIPVENIFDTEYKGKEVSYAIGFNLYRREWQVFFKDGSWILAGDQGNGWYNTLTDFNSFKII